MSGTYSVQLVHTAPHASVHTRCLQRGGGRGPFEGPVDGAALHKALVAHKAYGCPCECCILSACPQMGSGTDPAEGAALAGALLERLADTARLTYATTHHAELKELPVSGQVGQMHALPGGA